MAAVVMAFPRATETESPSISVLEKDVHSIVNSRQPALVGGAPVKIIGSNRKVSARSESIAEVESLAACSSAYRHIGIHGIVCTETGMDRIKAGQAQAQLRPTTATSYFPPGLDIDSLSGPAPD